MLEEKKADRRSGVLDTNHGNSKTKTRKEQKTKPTNFTHFGFRNGARIDSFCLCVLCFKRGRERGLILVYQYLFEDIFNY